MSATNVFIQANSVSLLTDALAYHPNGEIVMIGPKVVPLPHLNCAVAMRGPAAMRPIFAELIGNGASSFDGLRDIIVDLLRAGAENYASVFEDCRAGPEFEVVVAGISETTGPTAYLMASHDRYGTSWQVSDFSKMEVVLLPCDSETIRQVQESVFRGRAVDEIDPAIDGLAAMQIQRDQLIANAGMGGEFAAIGGFA
jgi:hypothetical protein